jgi:hypothetical protein
MSKATAKETVQNVTDYLNSFSSKEKAFIEEMNREHRTLQQSFTKLCLAWLENCASDDYHFDGRNEQSHGIAKDVLKGFQQVKDTNSKPSEWLGCI